MTYKEQMNFYNSCMKTARDFGETIHKAEVSGSNFKGSALVTSALVYALHSLKEAFGGTLEVTPKHFNLDLSSASEIEVEAVVGMVRVIEAKLIPPPSRYSRVR